MRSEVKASVTSGITFPLIDNKEMMREAAHKGLRAWLYNGGGTDQFVEADHVIFKRLILAINVFKMYKLILILHGHPDKISLTR